MKEIWVAGYPSYYGGADTELFSQIYLWRAMGADVHLVPMSGCNELARKVCDDLGCTTHKYEPHIFKDKVVVSYCSDIFLKRLPNIYERGKPRAVVWVNCMTFLFDPEIEAHKLGLITHFAFQTEYQRKKLTAELEKHHPVNVFPYRPYYSIEHNAQNLVYEYRAPTDYFGVGRVSRDDASKFAAETWMIFGAVESRLPVKAFVLGYGDNAHKKCGNACEGLDWQTYKPGEIPVKEFYGKIHVMIHKTGGSRENYPRTILECWNTGVVPIFERAWGLPEIIDDGVNGFLCPNSLEMAWRATQLGHNEPLRKKMVEAGYEKLTRVIANKELCWAPWDSLL